MLHETQAPWLDHDGGGVTVPTRDPARTFTAPTDGVYINQLVERLARNGDKPILRHLGQDTAAGEFLTMIHRYARAMSRIGVRRRNLIALLAPNTPDALAIRYATHLLGAASVFLSTPADPKSRAELIADMDPDLLIVFPETVRLLPEGVTARIATVGPDVPQAALRLDFLAADEPSAPVASQAQPDDLAVIISSGGTTGVPKGSWRTFEAYTAMVRPGAADRRQLVNDPLAYLSQILVDNTLLGGGSVVLENSCEPADTLATIEAERITDLFLVEPQLFDLMDHLDVARRDLSSLRSITHIGSSAPPILRRRARERLGPVIAHTYGASEMGIVSALAPAEQDPARPETFSCSGRVLPGVEIRFRKSDGTLAEPGEFGSIEVRSPAMAGGYRNRPDLEASAFKDGWYRSGDLGLIDECGWLHVMGRAVDITWIDGIMVSPTGIENALCSLPGVRYAVVVVDADKARWIAAVMPWPGATIDPARCRALIRQRYRAEPLVVVEVASMPLTEQGKPDREAIRRLGSQAAGHPVS
jgi:acyl-CoA synthetase (AMP-forming)/AMP-acid ligase II